MFHGSNSGFIAETPNRKRLRSVFGAIVVLGWMKARKVFHGLSGLFFKPNLIIVAHH
jgi:hypothetical protein